MDFNLTSQYRPTGHQPRAIEALTQGVEAGLAAQTLLGVTGSGKTFTIANVVNKLNRPTLVLSHNKTLAAQLYNEFKLFFPDNAVEYFVSYYDYYQPEAYIVSSDTYIAKDMSINAEIEKLRLRTTASLLSGRRDVIVVSSVSCLYGMANPEAFASKIITLRQGDVLPRSDLMRLLTESYYIHNKVEFGSGTFRVKGDTVDIFPAVEGYDGVAYRIEYWDDEIDRISVIHPTTAEEKGQLDQLKIYPANIFVTTKEQIDLATKQIAHDLEIEVNLLEREGKMLESKRLYERVTYDLEFLKELGYCPGIENYSRYFDGRKAGERPFCLLDYFPDDFLLVIDESHVTIPQIRAMYGGDKARKKSLIEYGFRLPAAADNRPLTFDEFVANTGQTIYVSATPAEYELHNSADSVVEQLIRPTGLLDPRIEVRPSRYQIDNLLEEIYDRREKKERVLVTTITKKLAEELNNYLARCGVRTAYIHSDVETLERIAIMDGLRSGKYDVLIGVNLLREGLDFPEVSLVAILDADKEGFLRSHRSLTQTAGRAARNIHGLVIFYADTITESMRLTIEETGRRRAIQEQYNRQHGITPTPLQKKVTHSVLQEEEVATARLSHATTAYIEEQHQNSVSPVIQNLSKEQLQKQIIETKKQMYDAAKELNFMAAAQLRDTLLEMQEQLSVLESS